MNLYKQAYWKDYTTYWTVWISYPITPNGPIHYFQRGLANSGGICSLRSLGVAESEASRLRWNGITDEDNFSDLYRLNPEESG